MTIIIIGAIAAIVIGISFVVDRYSWGTYDYRPFNPETIWASFVCGLLVAVGVYLWLGTGFTAIARVVLGCGILVYVGLLVFVSVRVRSKQGSSDGEQAPCLPAILIAIWTVTILSALFPVVVPLSTVWFILKPNDKINELERPSDTIDEDDDYDEDDYDEDDYDGDDYDGDDYDEEVRDLTRIGHRFPISSRRSCE